MDRRDRRSILVRRARIREIPSAGQRQGAILAAARTGTTSALLGTNARSTVPSAWQGSPPGSHARSDPTSRPAPGSTAARLAQATACQRPMNTISARTLPRASICLTIRVDNRLVVDVGINSHSVTRPHPGKLEWDHRPDRPWPRLRQSGSLICRYLPTSREGRPRCAVGSATQQVRPGRGCSSWRSRCLDNVSGLIPPDEPGLVVGARWYLHGGNSARECRALLWDEFRPALYRVTASDRPSSVGSRSATFGLREITTAGTQIPAERPEALSPRYARMRDLSAHRAIHRRTWNRGDGSSGSPRITA